MSLQKILQEKLELEIWFSYKAPILMEISYQNDWAMKLLNPKS
jgi:hypothetical protein